VAESNYSCSVRQGFNFEKDAQDLVGHINALKIGESQLAADLNVTDPENVATLKKVMGIVSGISWRGGYADPVTFSCQVSTTNKNTLSTLVHKSMSNTEVLLTFTIYDYDPKAKKYYQCFHSNAVALKGLVERSGGSLNLSINADQSMEVVSPKNYAFAMGVMPQDLNMEIHIAVSVTDKFVKKFCVEVAA